SMRSVRRLASFATSADAIDLEARITLTGIALSARMSARHDGPWARYVAQQHPGTLWGTEVLPQDSVLVYTTHMSRASLRSDVEDSLVFLDQAVQGRAARSAPDREPLRRVALENVISSLEGELAYAVWPAEGGGVGLGGAYKVNDVAAARKATLMLHAAL